MKLKLIVSFLMIFSSDIYSSQYSDLSSYSIDVVQQNGDEIDPNDYLGKEAQELLDKEFDNGLTKQNLTSVKLEVNHQTEEILAILDYSDGKTAYEFLKKED